MQRFQFTPHHKAPALSYPVQPNPIMITPEIMPVAALGWSLLYLILGGGFFGAILIFVVAKLFGK